MKYMISALVVAFALSISADAQFRSVQDKDSLQVNDSIQAVEDTAGYFPHPLPNILPAELFIPYDRLQGVTPWMGGPFTRPVVHVRQVYGFNGYGYGQFSVDHFDKFFSNMFSYNDINVPQVVDSQIRMLGNTLSLGKKRRWYFASGILYGRHFGTWGNMIGMGTREGLIIRSRSFLIINLWSQEYQSVYAYSPVVYAFPGEGTAAVKLPASPVMISYGAQAYFLAGQFWIGLGASYWHPAKPEH